MRFVMIFFLNFIFVLVRLMKKFGYIICLLSVILLSPLSWGFDAQQASDAYRLTDVSVLIDPGKKMGVQDIIKVPQLFSASEQALINFGFSNDNYWLSAKFVGQNDVERAVLEIANPKLDEVHVYLFQDEQLIYQFLTGDRFPFSQREMVHRNFVFPFSVQKGVNYQLFVKLSGRDNLRVPLLLDTEADFNTKNLFESGWIGALYGSLWVIVLNNLFFFIILKEREYLNLAVFLGLITLSLMNLDGINTRLFWPDSPEWNKVSLVVFQLSTMLVGLIFTRDFLHLKINSPWWDKVFQKTVYLFVLLLLLIPFISYYWLILGMSILALIIPPMVLAAAVMSLTRKYRPARFFLLAWCAVLVGTVDVGLVVHNILPVNVITLYGMHFGVFWLGVMLSVAMADRFNIVQQDRNKAQGVIIHQQQTTMNYQKKVMASISRFVPNQFLTLLEKLDITEVKYGDAVLKNMFIMFTDIRSFTALSEDMSAEENFEFLNNYMRYMEPVIETNHGFVDKFIGDAIMALFPETPDQALTAAIGMHNSLGDFNWQYENTFDSPVKIGIGIHGGDVVLGTVGTDVRLETTVIGDAVNVTSRLEALTKKYQASILISDTVYHAIHNVQQFSIRVVGLVELRGKKKPLLVYEVFNGDTEGLKTKKQHTAPLLEQAVGLLMVGKTQEARTFLEQCLQHYPDDPVTTELLAQYS